MHKLNLQKVNKNKMIIKDNNCFSSNKNNSRLVFLKGNPNPI